MMITYKSGYKYILKEDYKVKTNIFPGDIINTEFLQLDTSSILTLKKNYAWNGATGALFQTKTFMRGSLVHDALYQLIREGHLKRGVRYMADQLFYKILKEDKMFVLRRSGAYLAVRMFGGYLLERKYIKKLKVAP